MDTIIRVRKPDHFTRIPNSIFAQGLSLRAIGLLTYMLHLPSDWKLRKTHLYKNMPKDKRTSVQSAWEELKNAGYIHSIESKKDGKNLPELTYYLYEEPTKCVDFMHKSEINNEKCVDFKHAQNQHIYEKNAENQPQYVDFMHAENKHAQNQQLLNTNNKQKTKRTNIPSNPNGLEGAQVPDFATDPAATPPAKGRAPRAEKRASDAENVDNPKKAKKEPRNTDVYSPMMKLYFEWYEAKNGGIPPKVDGMQGNAMHSIIDYLRYATAKRAETDNEILTPGQASEKVIQGWKLVLDNWGSIDGWMQDKTRLSDVNTNFQNIINQIKNGIAKRKGNGAGPGKIAGADAQQLFQNIVNRFDR